MIKLLFVGFLLGTLNIFALKWTVKRFLECRSIIVIVLSFAVRMAFISLIFYLFLDKNWKNAIFMLLGLTISKIFFILIEKKGIIKK